MVSKSVLNVARVALLGSTVLGLVVLASPMPRLQLMMSLGLEPKGGRAPVAMIPGQLTAEGQPQVLVHGTNCQDGLEQSVRLQQELIKRGIPIAYKDEASRTPDDRREYDLIRELLPRSPDGHPVGQFPLVVVNGKLLSNPSADRVEHEYRTFKQQIALRR